MCLCNRVIIYGVRCVNVYLNCLIQIKRLSIQFQDCLQNQADNEHKIMLARIHVHKKQKSCGGKGATEWVGECCGGVNLTVFTFLHMLA